METGLILKQNYIAESEHYLKNERYTTNDEFINQFKKTFADLIFSQNDEMIEKLQKTNRNSLFNAVFKATEIGASFAKREISFIPFESYKKTNEKGVEKKVATGEYDAIVVVDINFQKQQILKLENCKRFFTAEVHEGVKVIEDLTTGLHVFSGENDVTKKTIGYYAVFETTQNETYDCFMTCAEIVERAKFSPQFKDKNYEKTGNNVHYEKIVIRNLIKSIPKLSRELSSILSYDENNFTEFEVVETKKLDKVEEAKKSIEEKNTKAPEISDAISEMKKGNEAKTKIVEQTQTEDYI